MIKSQISKTKDFGFKVIKKDGKTRARAGVISTSHGIVETPAFVPVGTQATVKGLTPQDLREIGAQILFGNTYHLHLRPGEDVVSDFGGVGKFMAWNGVTITDSGGFQVFSLARGNTKNRAQNNTEINGAEVGHENFLGSKTETVSHLDKGIGRSATRKNFVSSSRPKGEIRVNLSSDPCESNPVLVKITDEGVKFRSHIDGSLHMFTPEESIRIQHKLGADIILVFDECAPYPSTHEYTKQAMERTHKWALRSLKASQGKQLYLWKQALYGIVQGGVYDDLRKESAEFIGSMDFDGIAIGGVSVGETKEEMRKAVDTVVPFLPEEKSRHLLGIGEVDDIFDAVERGMDTFDCVIPTRFGRYGVVMVGREEEEVKGKFRIDITRTRYASSKEKLSADCSCFVCQTFTRGYIHHLFKAKELLAYRLVSYHNMYFTVNLVKKIRQSILDDQFEKLKKEWIRD
ncbi:tRNA guanosine(34) transglycosylase Tgt [Patescibacteria group bacterium]|nr:tRNA guanosine(34) transglycosylase Tgt [Patescibacteria group bacterium]